MMNYKILLFVLLSVSTRLVAADPAPVSNPPYASIPKARVYEFIDDIMRGWRGESRSKKSEDQKQVLFNDATGKLNEVFFDAVSDINEAFGYKKLVPQLTTDDSLGDSQILIFLGPYQDGRRLLRENGSRGSSFSDAWSGWFWWDENEAMSKSVVALAQERLSQDSFPFYLRRSILTALGYPGYSDAFGPSIFSSAGCDVKAAKNNSPVIFITEYDRLALRFCDRYFTTDASRSDIRGVIAKHWADFAAEADQKRAASPPPTRGDAR